MATGVEWFKSWMDWLTDDRLARWNHLRYRAGLDPIDRLTAVHILMAAKKKDPRALDDIKARIAE